MLNLRDRLILLLNEEGTAQKFIARKTGINEGYLSRFKNGQVELGVTDSRELDRFLESRGH